jgi:hypothetical protein
VAARASRRIEEASMITANALTRAAGIAAVAAGLLFIGVQIGHPRLNATTITTTNVYIRDQLKVLMAVLALVGITGMYLSQFRRNGVLGLIGYVLLAWLTCSSCAASTPPPGCCPKSPRPNSGYVNDLIAVDTGRGTVEGDIGALQTVIQLRGYAYLAGGLLFGIALFRAHVLARWAAALLAVGGLLSVVLSLMPDAFYRFLAVPNGVAMIGLGVSLWRSTWTELNDANIGSPDLRGRTGRR